MTGAANSSEEYLLLLLEVVAVLEALEEVLPDLRLVDEALELLERLNELAPLRRSALPQDFLLDLVVDEQRVQVAETRVLLVLAPEDLVERLRILDPLRALIHAPQRVLEYLVVDRAASVAAGVILKPNKKNSVANNSNQGR